MGDHDDHQGDVRLAFAATLREYRERANISQDALAVNSGVHRSHLVRLEHATVVPGLNTVFQICGALRVAVAVFIADVEKRMGI